MMKSRCLLLSPFAAVLLAGCAHPPQEAGINDPLEPANRAVHSFNKGLDKIAVRPLSMAYGTIVPEPARLAVSNVADTLSLPGTIANDLLQADIGAAGTNTLRLGLNLTFGLAGTIDFASAAGMPETDNDFGKTLAVLGVGEGPYVELPGFGPSTMRDAFGRGVDIALNPVGHWLKGNDGDAAFGAEVLNKLNDRYTYSETFDGVLYDSADSYAQLRLAYLQNRRFELGQSGVASSTDDFIDPYED